MQFGTKNRVGTREHKGDGTESTFKAMEARADAGASHPLCLSTSILLAKYITGLTANGDNRKELRFS